MDKAIIEYWNGKSIKDAAEMFGIGRSALCKRIHLKGLGKNGQAIIPPALKNILMTGNCTLPGMHLNVLSFIFSKFSYFLLFRFLDMTKPVPRYASLLGKKKKKTDFGRADLDAAIGEVMFGKKDRNDTAWKYNIPNNTLTYYLTHIKKMFKGSTMTQAEVIAKIEKIGDTTGIEGTITGTFFKPCYSKSLLSLSLVEFIFCYL
jgi:hypothetical protein